MTLREISVDIETLSTRNNASILSIGAVRFDRQTLSLGESFYRVVGTYSRWTSGHIEAATVKWWEEQSVRARMVFTDPDAKSIDEVLADFAAWVREDLGEDDRVFLWGNGPGFDNAIIREAYLSRNLQAPWRYSEDRDFRTIVDLAGLTSADIDEVRFGIHHHAGDDAISQALAILRAFRVLRGGVEL